MARFLYSSLFILLLPVVFLSLYLRGSKSPAYRQRWLERIGMNRPLQLNKSIWVHAVSVGEVIAAVPLVREFQRRYPDYSIVVTTMTPTGSDRVKAIFGDSVYHQYLPYDIPWALGRFIKKTAPQICIVMETELWPNLIHQCYRRNIAVVVSNARLSESSAAGYRRLKSLSKKMLGEVGRVLAQTEIEGQRFVSLGLPPANLQVTGSLKFDIEIEDRLRDVALELRQDWLHRPCLIAASTHQGEDELILDAFNLIRQSHGDALLILVPRHPERFEQVAALLDKRQYSFVRRSHAAAVNDDHAVLLGDTMGELLTLLGAADIAFVGGSLVDTGGHNVLEPIAMGVATITGPHTFNFQAITELLLQRNGITVVSDEINLAQVCVGFFTSPDAASAQVSRGNAVLNENKGALAKQLQAIDELIC
ncbi:MAG: 3-deoxy-D-manno-octulosonic acid transferase [Moraxellaceae bacterium]|nr:MAG: 3-deoxy-D-manno-octulosonic acid transferase [Moraxellaceae bacterium]